MLKKFDNDAIARFCWSDKNSRAAEKKKTTATGSISRLTESNLSVNNNNNNKKELDQNQESSPLLRWSLIKKNLIKIKNLHLCWGEA